MSAVGSVIGIGLVSVLATRLVVLGLVVYLERRWHALDDIAQVVRAIARRR